MILEYLICYDRQTPTAWATYDTPAPGTGISNASIPLTDPAILAKVEELNALVASTMNLTRRPDPNAPPVS